MSLIFFEGQIEHLKKEFNISLVSSPGPQLDEKADSNGVHRYPILMKREIALFQDLKSLINLIILFKKERPAIIHGNTPKASFLSMIAAWITNVPTRIYYCHGLRYQGETGTKRKILMMMERISCYFSTHTIAVSKGVQETLLTDKITSKIPKVIWNGSINGINLDHFDPNNSTLKDLRSLHNIKQEDFVFGFIGRIVGDKGINELVEVFVKINVNHPGTKLLLVGHFEEDLDPVSKSTRYQIEHHPNIIYAGSQKDVRPFYKMMDVFVFPSYREGFGLSVMEAAAMEKPAISFDIIGVNEIIENGKSGFLIPLKDIYALQEKMELLLLAPTITREMSHSSRKIVAKKYDQNILWQKTIEYYKDISIKV